MGLRREVGSPFVDVILTESDRPSKLQESLRSSGLTPLRAEGKGLAQVPPSGSLLTQLFLLY